MSFGDLCVSTQEASEKNFIMLLKNYSCYILVRKMAAICPCLKSLPDFKVKSFGLITLVEEISKQPSIDSVSWLQVLMLMKIYNKKKQAEQGKYLWRKRSPGSGLELSSLSREIE